MHKTTYSVREMSEILDKSTSTIYIYLQNGKLKGEKIDGEWFIEYPEINELTTDNSIAVEDNQIEEIDGELTTIEDLSTKKINQDMYIEHLESNIQKHDDVLENITQHLHSKLHLESEIASLLGEPQTNIDEDTNIVKQLLAIDETYQSLRYKKLKLEVELKEIHDKYAELEEIINSVDVIQVQYSKTSESTYIKINAENLVALLNKLSNMNKRFIIGNENIGNRSVIRIRFSSHLPLCFSTFNCKTVKDHADIYVPYKGSEKEFNLITKHFMLQKQRLKEEELINNTIEIETGNKTEATKQKIINKEAFKDLEDKQSKFKHQNASKQNKMKTLKSDSNEAKARMNKLSLKDKIEIAREYSTESIKSFTKEELHDYKIIVNELLTNSSVTKEGFIKNLPGKKVAINKKLKEM